MAGRRRLESSLLPCARDSDRCISLQQVLAPAALYLKPGGGALALGTVAALPPAQVIVPGPVPPTGGGSPFATTAAQSPVLVIAPVAPDLSGKSLGTTAGQPPVLVIAPVAPNLSGASLGTTAGQPPVLVIAPTAHSAATPGTTVAEPPLAVKIGNQ
jgi:hypothetical protein